MTDASNNSAPPPPLPADATAAQAGERLAFLTAHKEWSGKLLAGDVATKNEWQQLTEKVASADATEGAIDGTPAPAFEPNVDGVSRADLAKATSWLREDGLTDGVIRDVVNGKEIFAEDRATAQRHWDRCRNSEECGRRLVAGDPEVRQNFAMTMALLNATVRETAA
jgi:hypothetical protein